MVFAVLRAKSISLAAYEAESFLFILLGTRNFRTASLHRLDAHTFRTARMAAEIALSWHDETNAASSCCAI